MNIVLSILLILLLLLIFSLAEKAFLLSNKLLFELGVEKRSLPARVINIFHTHPNRFQSFVLIVNVILLVAYVWENLKMYNQYQSSEGSLAIVFVHILVAVLLWVLVKELLAKSLVSLNSKLSFSIVSIPVFLAYVLLFPINWFCLFLGKGILSLFGVKLSEESKSGIGREELDDFIQQTIEESSDDADLDNEMKFFQNAMDFSTLKIRDCMVPRTEIVAVEKDLATEELITLFVESGYSKLIVYTDDVDNIIGYIHSSELFTQPEDWTKSIVSLPFVPENMSANKLMKTMLAEKKNMAVVVDEFGGTSGIITLEDLVEEIFGEIEDEHDNKKIIAKQLNENEYVLSGRLEIDQLNEKFEFQIPESDEYITLAGYILNHHQTFPKVNEVLHIDNYHFKIIKVTRNKIELVRLRVE